MLNAELKEISKHLENIAIKEDRIKFNLYMNKSFLKGLEKIERKRSEYYMNVVGPFLQKYEKQMFNTEPNIADMITYLRNKYNTYLHFQQPELASIAEKIFQNSMNFEFFLNNKKVNFDSIATHIETNRDPKMRKLAWNNFLILGERNKELYFHLFFLRKKAAHKLGFPDLYQWSIAQRQIQDISVPVKIIAKVVRNKIEKLLYERFNIKMSHLHPWDLKYYCLLSSSKANEIFRQRVKTKQFKNILEKVINKSGYNLNELNINFYKAQIPYDGLCIGTYSKKADILFNPRGSFESLTYLFHEFGHAFHTVRQKSNCYLSAEAEDNFFYEGVAYCFEKIAVNQEFIEEELGLQKRDALALLQQAKFRQLFDILSILIRLEFEKKIYKYDINLNEIDKVYADIYKDFTGIEHPPNAYWASPVYFARDMFTVLDYLLAENVVEQTMPAIYRHPYYKNYLDIVPLVDKYYVSQTLNWNKKIKNLTGSYLTPKFLIKEVKSENK